MTLRIRPLYVVDDKDSDETRCITVAENADSGAGIIVIHPLGDGDPHVAQLPVGPPPRAAAIDLVATAKDEAGGWTSGAVNVVLRRVERIPYSRVDRLPVEIPDPDN